MSQWIDRYADRPADEIVVDEDFWEGVRGGYRLKPDYINLENGYYNILPNQILDAFIGHVRDVNMEGAHYMRTVQFERKKAMAIRLAGLAGCAADELVITM